MLIATLRRRYIEILITLAVVALAIHRLSRPSRLGTCIGVLAITVLVSMHWWRQQHGGNTDN